MKKFLAMFFAMLFLSSAVFGQDEGEGKPFYMPKVEDGADYPNIKIGGQSFFDYTYMRAAGANANAFHVNRALLMAYGDLSEYFEYATAIDVAPFFGLQSGNNGTAVEVLNPGDVHLDLAYMAAKFYGHKLMVGVIPTAWEEFVLYNAWHHRRVAVSPYVGNGYSLNNRWDLGIALEGNFMENMLQVFAGFYNGESYLDITEVSNQKNFQMRVSVNPFEDMLVFSTGLEYEKPLTGGTTQIVVPVLIYADLMDKMIKPALLFTWERAAGAVDANAYMLSFMLNAFLMERKVNPFIRLDYGLDNEIGAVAGAPTLAKKDMNLFAGIGYHFNPYVVVDLALIWNRVDATDANTYTVGPFAEVRF